MTKPKLCPNCKGRGKVVEWVGEWGYNGTFDTVCRVCRGDGRMFRKRKTKRRKKT